VSEKGGNMRNHHCARLKEVIIIILLLLPLGLHGQIENWVYHYDGSGDGSDKAWSIVYGQDGNIYAAGCAYGSTSLRDLTVISLTSDGDTNWIYCYNGPNNTFDEAWSIDYGQDGNIYAAGYSFGIGTSNDFTVISLASTGDTNWTYRYNGSGSSYDIAYSVVYGQDGNIYAAGYSHGSGSACDFTVISLASTGDTNWTYRYNGSGNSFNVALSIVYGQDGNIYAAGYSTDSVTSRDFTVISLTSNGDTNWTYCYNGPGDSHDEAWSIDYGQDDIIYAAGYSRGVGLDNDFTVISLASTGDTNWTYRHNGSADGADYANSIVCGHDGNIYTAGVISNINTAEDFAVVSLTNHGSENWVYTYDGPAPFYPIDKANSVVYGLDGNIYAAGYSMDYVTTMDFTVISLTSAGDENWIYRYTGPQDSDDEANSIVYGQDGNIYASGFIYVDFGSDFAVISLCYLDVGTISIDIQDTVPEDTTLNPQATVKNLSTMSATFDVTCMINPGAYTSSYMVTDLASGDSIQVTFPDAFMFGSGSYTVTVYTQLENDGNHDNDTLEKVIETYDPGISEGSSAFPQSFSFFLKTNPAKGKVVFNLLLPEASPIILTIYDVTGKIIDKLSESKSAGYYQIPWDSKMASGVYFYKFESSWEIEVGKFILVK
jgi:uncharacterized delta-60 repeat protein